jgi:hypothetical protein
MVDTVDRPKAQSLLEVYSIPISTSKDTKSTRTIKATIFAASASPLLKFPVLAERHQQQQTHFGKLNETILTQPLTPPKTHLLQQFIDRSSTAAAAAACPLDEFTMELPGLM